MGPETPTDGRDVEWSEDTDDPNDPKQHMDEAFADAESRTPEDVPLYLAEDIRGLDDDRLAAVAEWVEKLNRRRQLEAEQTADVKPGDGSAPEPGSVIEKYQQCGKAECKCSSGDETDMHGPYRYRITSDGDGGQTWEYIGKA